MIRIIFISRNVTLHHRTREVFENQKLGSRRKKKMIVITNKGKIGGRRISKDSIILLPFQKLEIIEVGIVLTDAFVTILKAHSSDKRLTEIDMVKIKIS